jgi:SNF family Na+-dependent transporter
MLLSSSFESIAEAIQYRVWIVMVGWVKLISDSWINDFFQMFHGWKFGYRAIVEKKNYKISVKEILREISFISQMLEILYQDDYIYN